MPGTTCLPNFNAPNMEIKLHTLFEAQRKNQYVVGNTDWKERIRKLHTLQLALEKTFRGELRQALYDDFRKPFIETDLTEIYQVVREIKHAKNHLRRWMSVHRVSTPLALSGTSSWYQYEPKGSCLIISPWNFPVNLTFGPLVSAIAAGNTAILKPSELTPHTSAVMAKIVKELFPADEVSMVEGGIDVSRELLRLPFNHIFFTGSPGVGKIVMKAGAEHLSSVTLELGGKSPVIVDETANLDSAANKITWGKFLNSGQICVSPDYLLVKDSVKDLLMETIRKQLHNFYTDNPSESNSYSRIVNKTHYQRLVGHLEDAKSKGATLIAGGQHEVQSCYIAPTILTDLPETATLMQEEIFGPLLPVISYKSTDEAISYINAREKPLALYIYSRDRPTIDHILKQTRAGSSCINTNVLQYTNVHLPFGGVNNSGVGKSHGYYGFREFSNQRSVLEQHFPTAMELLFPPYNEFKQRLANFTLRWL
jgi:aldehyde dehydrogenase (NAD+)